MRLHRYLVSTLLTLVSWATATPLDPKPDLPAIIFVPGAFHPAKVFDHVIAGIRKDGYHHLQAVDLPSVGHLATREDDIQAVRAAITKQLEAGRNVVLVGNSYGCTVLGEAVQNFTSALQTDTTDPTQAGKPAPTVLGLVFLAGFIPSLSELESPSPRPDIRTFSPPYFRFDEPGKVYCDGDLAAFPPQQTFFNAAPRAAADYWATQLDFSSFDALNATARYVPYTGDFNVVYVAGGKDHAIAREWVDGWIAQSGVRMGLLERAEWDHVPMVSFPEEVVRVVEEFAVKTGAW